MAANSALKYAVIKQRYKDSMDVAYDENYYVFVVTDADGRLLACIADETADLWAKQACAEVV